ncbi:MAG TPA: dienelactone hydrolase family protein [Armatimonadota bacterium]|jgi:dienelactone hydrolase
MKVLVSVIAALWCLAGAEAKLQTKVVDYKQGDVDLQGYLARDDSFTGKRPGVLVVHEWTGEGPYVRRRADMLAKLGYVAFACDIYGKGVRPSPAEAGAVAGKYKNDRALLRRRAAAGLDVLRNDPHVDAKRLAAIGYCFGGTTALELARSGADLAAVVSFHGTLETPNPADARNIKGRVLVLAGADDRASSPEALAAFQDEMRKAGVDYQIVLYGGAVHAFTNPDAGNDPSIGAAYNEKADRRSWQAMQDFFNETLAKPD